MSWKHALTPNWRFGGFVSAQDEEGAIVQFQKGDELISVEVQM